ncbi:ubiquitin carboxyl-terminal hydrolase 36 [Anopheles nili]|uniref:ubiquitin carboxyl-terminal hydrolase 36 n=1 Tax=Anopheles nili TaxID=185578 RepID=UPI00237A19D6|nr:ubiquitin carboxyl-terminal hydrolase 36 [Anopheles nili]
MPIQMVCDSTSSLVSAALRNALHPGTAMNGRSSATSGLNYSAASSGNCVTTNGTTAGSSSAFNKTDSSSPTSKQAFRRTPVDIDCDIDFDSFDDGDDDQNDLVKSISLSLRQGQQIKPIKYEEVESFSASSDQRKFKHIVLNTTTEVLDNGMQHSAGSSLSYGASSGFLMHASKTSTTPITSTMNGGSALKFSSTTQSSNLNKVSVNVLQQNGVPATTSSAAAGKMDTSTLPTPKRILFPRENVQIGWKTTGRKWLVGAGMMNMGNTCYLNSTLQALFHVPAIVNWLLSDEQHRAKCDDGGSGGSCIICAMAKTLLESQTNQNAFRPYLVYSKLRLVCKHLVPGRQEDAHEFLRYLVEAMEKSYLGRSKNSKELDQYSKETTPLNQILGGYLRSEVKCLSCQHVSTTFQHFEDLLLDIRKADSIDEALELYFARERLEEMGYKCEACKRRVAATKQFSLERAPFVLCVQLKRFSMLGSKINKHIEQRSKLDLSSYSSPALRSTGAKLAYRLTSMVTHLGSTQHCGHYTAIGHTDAGGYYVFDDSSVRPIGIQNVMSTNAYILFYELESAAAGTVGLPNGACRAKATVSVGQPSSTATLASMGLSNGGSPVGFGGGMSSGTGNGGSTGGGSGGGTPGKAINSSPLRVVANGVGHGNAGGPFPSKLEQKPSFIGPVLPNSTAASATTSLPVTGTIGGKPHNNGGHNTLPSANVTSSSACRELNFFSSPSSTTSSLSNSSSLCSPVKLPAIHPTKNHKLQEVNSRSTTAVNGVHSEKLKSLSSSLPMSMPKLQRGSPNKPVENTNGFNASVISLVPYDSDDTSSTSEDESNRTPSTSKMLPRKFAKDDKHVNGNKEADDDEEVEDGRTHTIASRSPKMIKTKIGLWKVSKSSSADQLSYPESGSGSSSKSTSPATSGGSSPTSSPGQQQTKPQAQHNGVSASPATPLINGYRHAQNGNGGGTGVGTTKQRSFTNSYHPVNGGSNLSSSFLGEAASNGGASTTVQILQKYSQRGYGAPVKTWNGQTTAMDRELAIDRREERKRQIEDDRETEMDRGRTKKTKAGGGGGAANGTNLFQQYQNHPIVGGKWMANGGGGNRNGNYFHNHHQNNYRGGGGGGSYYQGGNGHRYHGGGSAGNGGFRNGARRFGGRNGGGYHTKAHHHHQRNESGSGMAGSGGGNGFCHR